MTATSRWTSEALERLADIVTVVREPPALEAAARDFGGLCQGSCPAVLRPADAGGVAAVLAFANRHGLGITVRGGGLGQSGQSVAADSASLELQRLDGVEVLPASAAHPAPTVRCGPGASFRRLRDACTPLGLLPAVLPFNLDLGVGGVLSGTGGFGSTSHREGLLVSSVRALEVVLGTGERVTATPEQRRDVYDAVLGGLGRCGVITAVELALGPQPRQLRTFFLLYDELDLFLADQLRIQHDGRCLHLEGFCSAAMQGMRKDGAARRPFARWFYGLQLGFGFDGAQGPDPAAALASLRHRELVHVEDADPVEHTARYDLRFVAMRATGAWQQRHPWVEYFLPARLAQQLVPGILDLLPPFLADTLRLGVLAPRPEAGGGPALLMGPGEKPMFAFAILPVGVPEPLLPRALEALAEVDRRLLAGGAKRILAGWLFQRSPAAWQVHFGDLFPRWQQIKHALDPRGVLRSALFPAE